MFLPDFLEEEKVNGWLGCQLMKGKRFINSDK